MFTSLSKQIVMRFTRTHLFFILNDHYTQGKCSLYCEIPESGFFCEYSMAGVDENDEKIVLEVGSVHLLRALRGWQMNSNSFKFKLSKNSRDEPVMMFEIETVIIRMIN